jgi:hypothetical protein
MFSRHLPDNALEEWKPTLYNDYPAIVIANRYFSERRLCPCVEAVPFHPSVDPKGVLGDMTGDKLVHTQENHVDYYEQIGSTVTRQQKCVHSASCDGSPLYRKHTDWLIILDTCWQILSCSGVEI